MQARQIFSLYLTYISKLLKKLNSEKHYDNINSSSNLLLMFLIKASKSLSIPLEIEVQYK